MADETFKLVEKMSEAPTFVQNIEQSVQEAPEEFGYTGPLKPPEILDYLKEPAAWFKSGMGGLAGGVGAVAKTASLIPGMGSILEPTISMLDESAKWWEPKEDAPGRVSNWVRGAFTSSGQSISAGFAGGVAALALGPGIAAIGGAGVAAATLGAILSKGLTFGGAQYYDLTKDIEREFKARGANPEEIAIIQKENAAWKAASAISEVGGEYASDFISARIFGLTGNPAIRAPIKAGIMAAFGKFAKKMGWAQLAEIAGEEMTTAVEYKAAEAITLPQPDYWKQVVDTAAVTGIQTLMMGAGASAVASTRKRSNEAFLQDFKAKASAALQEKGVNKDTADTIADSIIKRSSKTDAVDSAITELEARAEARKATKEERVIKKAEQKKTAAEKSKDIIQKILAPEAVAEEKLAAAEVPTAREEKLAKLKGEPLTYREGPTIETALRQPTEVALPKQEVTFIKLASSETAEVPDVIVEDLSGHPAIFNPDIHIMNDANMKTARRDIENWTPTAKVETTRERRLRILQEAGRIAPEQPVQVPVVGEEVEVTSTPAEVVAIMKKLRPGFVEHVNAMSKKGWSIDDFINDPDVSADLEGVVPTAKYYDLIMDIKEEIGAMTSTDTFDRQVREEQRALDKDFADIDKMKNEDLMQKEPAEADEYYDVEQHKWVQLEKEETVDNIEKQFVEPPPTIEKVPVVVQVPDRKVFSKKVVNNTVWFQPKEEALTQFDLLKQTKLDWNSDVDTMLHALSTQANVAYHTDGRVPFDALSKLSSNLDYFKKNLSHSEYDRLINSLNSLRAFMVDISDALKTTDTQAAPPTRLEKYNSEVRYELARDLIDSIIPETGPPRRASFLLDFMLANRESFTATEVALVEYLDNPRTRSVLKNVKVVLDDSGGAAAFYGGPVSVVARKYGGPVIGFISTYDAYSGKHASSVGEDILHELVHALTIEIMENSKVLTDGITNLRLRAIDNLGENDKRIMSSLTPQSFYTIPYKNLGLSRSEDYLSLYYGLTSNNEFIASIFIDPELQGYLASIPTEKVERGGTVSTLWIRFKELLSLALFNKSMSERESTLLDAALKAGREVIDLQADYTYKRLSYEAKERSVNASTPRIKSIEVEHVLQNYPLKGSGIHAGLGTPIQQNVFVKERPVDITELATYVESPLFALRDHPDALQFAGEAIDAVGTWAYNRSLGFMEIDRITKDLSEKEREKITSIMKEIESGEVINLDTLDPKIKNAVADTRKLLDAYKAKHKKFLRESLILGANSTEARIFADVLVGGESVLDVTKKWNRYARDENKTGAHPRVATTTYADMLDLFKEWKEIENFGIKDYITHAMRGSIALIGSKGNIISFAQTKKTAVSEALQYLKDHPDVDSIEVDTTYRLDKDFQTLVSQKYYRTMKGKIAKLVNQYAKDINKDLAEKLKAELPGRGIAIKPQKIWSQFLQEREEVLPGEKDIFDILPLYIHSIEKKHAIDPYILKLRDHLHEFNDRPKVKKMLEDQLQAIRGEYSVGDAIVDNILAKFGFEQSFSYTRGLAATRVLLTNLKLGYRPVASLINLMSGMGHIWVKTSAKYMIEAQRMLGTEGGKEFIKKNAPSLGVSIVEGMGGDLESRLRWYSPLKLFQAPEIPNRELSFMTSYLFARDQYGHDETEAVEFAKRSVDLQEFNYSIAALPKILRGPTGKTIGQFKAYLIKEIEFIRGLKGANQWAKYLTMQAVLGGPRGLMITLKSLPVLATIAGGGGWLDDLDTWLNNNYPRLSRGVFGFFGIDASAPASFQFPEKVGDWAGILISDIVRFGRDVVQPIANGESYLWEDIKKFGKGTVPIWRVWDEAWQGIINEEGWVLDEHGNNKYKVEDWTELVRMVGGFKLLKSSVQDLELRMSKVLEDKEKAQANKIVEQIVKRSRLIDVDIVTEELVQEVAAHAISPDTIIDAIERSHLDPATRQLLKSKMARRMELWQRQLPLREFRGY